jgi:hypothetical protein
MTKVNRVSESAKTSRAHAHRQQALKNSRRHITYISFSQRTLNLHHSQTVSQFTFITFSEQTLHPDDPESPSFRPVANRSEKLDLPSLPLFQSPLPSPSSQKL